MSADFIAGLAERLIDRYAFGLRLRALGAVQLAVASRLKNHRRVESFVAADKVRCEVAAREGFLVINPEAAA